MAYKTINPYTGKELKSFDEFTDEALENKLQAAQALKLLK